MPDMTNEEMIKIATDLVEQGHLLHMDVPTEARATFTEMTVQVRQLRKDDVLHDPVKGHSFCKVVTNDPKDKWATMVLENRAGLEVKFRAAVDFIVLISRPNKDADDTNKMLLARMVEQLFEVACKALPEPITIDPAQSWIERDLEKVAQAHVRWRRVYGPMLRTFVLSHTNEKGLNVDFFTALIDTINNLRRDIFEERLGGTSRSTSAWSNIVEDVQFDVYRDTLTRNYSGWERISYLLPSIFGTDNLSTLLELRAFNTTEEV